MIWMTVINRLCVYAFPFQAVLGIGGNLLNLFVLLSSNMKSRANTLLASTALADIIFLCALAPNYLVKLDLFNTISRSESQVMCENGTNGTVIVWHFTNFYVFYLQKKAFFTFLANWASCISSWLIVSVSFERLLAIKSPLLRRYNALSRTLIVWVIAIVLFSFFATVHHTDSRTEEITTYTRNNCINHTKGITRFDQGTHLSIRSVINMLVSVLVPLTLLVIVNAFLIYYLRNRRQFFVSESTSVYSKPSTNDVDGVAVGATLNAKSSGDSRRSSENLHKTSRSSTVWSQQLSSQQRKVTITVALIVTCYLLTHIFSVVVGYNTYIRNKEEVDMERLEWMKYMNNMLIVTGKCLNFLLFCISSKHFRSLLWQKLRGIRRSISEQSNRGDLANPIKCMPLLNMHERMPSSPTTTINKVFDTSVSYQLAENNVSCTLIESTLS